MYGWNECLLIYWLTHQEVFYSTYGKYSQSWKQLFILFYIYHLLKSTILYHTSLMFLWNLLMLLWSILLSIYYPDLILINRSLYIWKVFLHDYLICSKLMFEYVLNTHWFYLLSIRLNVLYLYYWKLDRDWNVLHSV